MQTLSELTRSPSWPDRWMTLQEISNELDERDAWERIGAANWSWEGRLHWLRRALEEGRSQGRSIWLRVGGRYKHFELILRNRPDVNHYLDWVQEVREARRRQAEALLNGEDRGRWPALHPLAPEPAECVARAEALAGEIIALLPDEQVAARVRRIWDDYQKARPDVALACLRVCRLIFALAIVYLETLRQQGVILGKDAPAPLRRLDAAVTAADRWSRSLFCQPVLAAEVYEREAA